MRQQRHERRVEHRVDERDRADEEEQPAHPADDTEATLGAVRREFSAGGVVVRRLRGGWRLAAIKPGGKDVWAPEGPDRPGESPAETAAREVTEETGVEGRLVGKLGDVRYVYTWEGERVFKVVSFYLFRYARGRLGEIPAEHAHEVDADTLAPPGRGARASRLQGRARDGRRAQSFSPKKPYDGAALSPVWPMYALNFYSPIVADQLRSRRKTATIRLGDKSGKYKKDGRAGPRRLRYGPREKIFDAVIDKVEVKPLGECSRGRSRRTTRRSSARRHGQLPRPALQPRRDRGRHGHGHPLLRDPGVAAARPSNTVLLGNAGRLRMGPPKSSGRAAPRRSPRTDRKRGRDPGAAAGAADAEPAAAGGTRGGELGLVLGEVALHVTAEAERRPVAERPAPLLPEPVGGLAHACTLATDSR